MHACGILHAAACTGTGTVQVLALYNLLRLSLEDAVNGMKVGDVVEAQGHPSLEDGYLMAKIVSVSDSSAAAAAGPCFVVRFCCDEPHAAEITILESECKALTRTRRKRTTAEPPGHTACGSPVQQLSSRKRGGIYSAQARRHI